MSLPDHFFISSTDGALHDTRRLDWPSHPLRSNYCRTHSRIRTVADLKATLRAGPYAWPGGYPLYLICDDDTPLCFACARSELRQIVQAMRDNWRNGWFIIACGINYEDVDMYCAHCNEPIESAYGEEEDE